MPKKYVYSNGVTVWGMQKFQEATDLIELGGKPIKDGFVRVEFTQDDVPALVEKIRVLKGDMGKYGFDEFDKILDTKGYFYSSDDPETNEEDYIHALKNYFKIRLASVLIEQLKTEKTILVEGEK